jgi:putative solute:sodium symporter small subunit
LSSPTASASSWSSRSTAIQLGGYPLGFWFAQQGSIYVFLVLIFVYAIGMNRLDKKFDVDED